MCIQQLIHTKYMTLYTHGTFYASCVVLQVVITNASIIPRNPQAGSDLLKAIFFLLRLALDLEAGFKSETVHDVIPWESLGTRLSIVVRFLGHRELLAPNNTLLKEGDILRRPLYADTLRKVGQYGADYFYNNLTFIPDMVKELQDEYGSIATVEDFANYSAKSSDPIVSNFSGGMSVLGVPPPSSGAVLALTLNILAGRYSGGVVHNLCKQLSCVIQVCFHSPS